VLAGVNYNDLPVFEGIISRGETNKGHGEERKDV
jgi:hypothetical protein